MYSVPDVCSSYQKFLLIRFVFLPVVPTSFKCRGMCGQRDHEVTLSNFLILFLIWIRRSFRWFCVGGFCFVFFFFNTNATNEIIFLQEAFPPFLVMKNFFALLTYSYSLEEELSFIIFILGKDLPPLWKFVSIKPFLRVFSIITFFQ